MKKKRISGQLPYCANLLRQGDYDRYLVSLFARASTREHIWALFAFDLEIARTREVVTDRTLGLIRLQWWREVLGGIYAGKTVHGGPVADGLARAIRVCDLPEEDFDTMIWAREKDLDDRRFTGLDDVLAFIDQTSVPLMRLAARVEGGEEDDGIAGGVARAYALTGVLQVFPLEQGLYGGKFGAGTMPDLLRENAVGNVVEKVKSLSSFRPLTGLFKAMNALSRLRLMQLVNSGCEGTPLSLRKPIPFKELRVWWGVNRS